MISTYISAAAGSFSGILIAGLLLKAAEHVSRLIKRRRLDKKIAAGR